MEGNASSLPNHAARLKSFAGLMRCLYVTTISCIVCICICEVHIQFNPHAATHKREQENALPLGAGRVGGNFPWNQAPDACIHVYRVHSQRLNNSINQTRDGGSSNTPLLFDSFVSAGSSCRRCGNRLRRSRRGGVRGCLCGLIRRPVPRRRVTSL